MTQEVLKLALEFLEDNQHYIADNENHLYLMMYNNVIEKCKEALAQQEQEPVATVTSETGADIVMSWWHEPALPIGTKLFTYAPQRTWVGLTGEEAMDVTRKEGHELLDFIYEYGTGSEGVEERIVAICKAIEAKLKQKNGYAEEKNNG